jgi:AcrR family transcriptional regulator
MENLLNSIKIRVNENIYVKDPETSILGKKILKESILLIDLIGFENFTFKKLGEKIGSNESSVYRYFENKHKLMVYLSSWYWSWMEYKLVFGITNITDAKLKLDTAIAIVTEKIEDDESTAHINESVLNKIIIAEFSKTMHTKEVDEENKHGFFLIYKRVITRIVSIVNEVSPEYKFAKSLISTVVEGALHQHFIKDHLKTITDCNDTVSPSDFYIDMVRKVLK